MINSILIFLVALLLVIKGATLATTYSAKLAEQIRLSKYVIGFVLVAFISILPETLIFVNSAFKGIPAFGLGTLFGSNVADLTLIFGILILYAGRGIKIESKILKNSFLYPFFLLAPVLLGLNGYYSRLDGALLIATGVVFYFLVFTRGREPSRVVPSSQNLWKHVALLLFAITLLLVGAHLTVTSATALAHTLSITPILIGMLVVGLGTTIPELFFSLESLKQKDDGLAIGDMLGSVLADATIVVGMVAVLHPFDFPARIVYITGVFMVIASLVLLAFMRSGKHLSKKEGYLLLGFWVGYALIEFLMGK